MNHRKAKIKRETKETRIEVALDLDGSGKVEAHTGVGFLDHMLDHLAVHSLCDLTVRASGDLEVDDHHTTEDVAICLGEALRHALGDKAGIRRYGSASVPMEEALANALQGCAASYSLYIQSSGNVRPCMFSPEEFTFGNAIKEPLKDIWQRMKQSELLTKWADQSARKGACGECPQFESCRGCLSRTTRLLGDTLETDPGCPLAAQYVISKAV